MPTKGSFDMSLSYTNTLNKKHYLPNGDELDVGSTRAEVISLRMTYGITDRLTISGGLPYVSTWYMGDFPHPGDVDDGKKNHSLSDWRVGLHYQVTEGPIAFAPYVQFMAPITDYATLGHASRAVDSRSFGWDFSRAAILTAAAPQLSSSSVTTSPSSRKSSRSATTEVTWISSSAIASCRAGRCGPWP